VKEGKSLQALVTEIERQQKSKRDFIADASKLSFGVSDANDSVMLNGVNGGMALRPTAHAQLATTIGVPKVYYDRMLKDAPDLLARNANHWLTRMQGTRRMVRTIDGEVRAVLSDGFRSLDNYDLLHAVLPTLATLQATVLSSEITENRLYLKAVTDRVQGSVKVGDVVQAGVIISNSEVGQGQLSEEFLDYRLICLNGMIREAAIKRRHVGRRAAKDLDLDDAVELFRDDTRKADDRAFFLKVRDVTKSMFDPERFNARLDEYRAAGTRMIEAKVPDVVEVTAKKFGLSDAESDSVLQHLIRGGDLSAWGISNGITRAAQDVDDYDRSVELETIGGKVIELSDSEWKALAV
jgi:hypothetical protein